MSRPPKLTDTQRRRLARLEPALRNAVNIGNLNRAKALTSDIKDLLHPTGHEARLMQAKNWYFEALLYAGEVETAKAGCMGVRAKTNKRTRVYLEATALLALCLIRLYKLDEAEPYMAEVLRDDKYITSERRRREFRKRIIGRFGEEGALAALRGSGYEKLDKDDIHEAAGNLVSSETEDGMYIHIADAVPVEVVNYLHKVDQLAKNLLPPHEAKYLPPPPDHSKKRELGQTIFASIKSVTWRALCDPESDVHKLWSKGAKAVWDEKYIAGAVAIALSGQAIGIKMLAVSCTALVMRLGVDVFCDRYKPESIMGARQL